MYMRPKCTEIKSQRKAGRIPAPPPNGSTGGERCGTAPNRKRRAKHVVVADDSEAMRALIRQALEGCGLLVTECSNGSELYETVLKGDGSRDPAVDLVISDVRMPHVTGMDFLQLAREAGQEVPVVLITAFGEAAAHAQAVNLGALALFDKPVDVDELVDFVTNILSLEGARDPH
jgi:two-component system, response regulator, stage 0 sporulation protein F